MSGCSIHRGYAAGCRNCDARRRTVERRATEEIDALRAEVERLAKCLASVSGGSVEAARAMPEKHTASALVQLKRLTAERNEAQALLVESQAALLVMQRERDEALATAKRMGDALNGEFRAYMESDGRNELRKAHERQRVAEAHVETLCEALAGEHDSCCHCCVDDPKVRAALVKVKR